jgi:SAM-dependent methyltransferase
MSIADLSTYQSFDFLGSGETKSSDSYNKYEKSKINVHDLFKKCCLDVGCNAGYFCYKMHMKGADRVVGIDSSTRFIDLANAIKHENDKFRHSNINFIMSDFFGYTFDCTFDFVICFSTYHYFMEKQTRFISDVYNIINKNGIFILEVEEHPSDEAKIFECMRPADAQTGRALCFPTRSYMKNAIAGKFMLLEEPYESVFQPGSLFKRYFYRMEKI